MKKSKLQNSKALTVGEMKNVMGGTTYYYVCTSEIMPNYNCYRRFLHCAFDCDGVCATVTVCPY